MGKRACNKRCRRQLAEARSRQPVPPTPQTEAEAAVWWLTGGSVPPEHCFLADDMFCLWSPERVDLLICDVCDGDRSEHEGCRAYLRRSGAAFPSVEAVRAEVQRRGLPGTQDT